MRKILVVSLLKSTSTISRLGLDGNLLFMISYKAIERKERLSYSTGN